MKYCSDLHVNVPFRSGKKLVFTRFSCVKTVACKACKFATFVLHVRMFSIFTWLLVNVLRFKNRNGRNVRNGSEVSYTAETLHIDAQELI